MKFYGKKILANQIPSLIIPAVISVVTTSDFLFSNVLSSDKGSLCQIP